MGFPLRYPGILRHPTLQIPTTQCHKKQAETSFTPETFMRATQVQMIGRLIFIITPSTRIKRNFKQAHQLILRHRVTLTTWGCCTPLCGDISQVWAQKMLGFKFGKPRVLAVFYQNPGQKMKYNNNKSVSFQNSLMVKQASQEKRMSIFKKWTNSSKLVINSQWAITMNLLFQARNFLYL